MFALVRRPRELWVDVNGGVTADPVNQIRSDISSNVSIGSVGNFSVDNIGGINRPYYLGEEISIRKLNTPVYADNVFFRSEFDDSHFTASKSKYNEAYLTRDPAGAQSVYGNSSNWDISRIYPLYPVRGGNALYMNGSFVSDLSSTFKYNTSYNLKSSFNSTYSFPSPVTISDPENRYAIGLKKYSFEVFWRYFHTDNVADYDTIINYYGLQEHWNGTVIDGHYNTSYRRSNYLNNYLWCNSHSPSLKGSAVAWNNCAWEDTNADEKARVASSECQPLVVTTPNTFPTPKTRAAGAFKFDPTYSHVIVS
jgi:hypothetical protein